MSISTPSGSKRLVLPEPGQEYDRQALIFNHTALEEADRGNFKKFQDVDLANERDRTAWVYGGVGA